MHIFVSYIHIYVCDSASLTSQNNKPIPLQYMNFFMNGYLNIGAHKWINTYIYMYNPASLTSLYNSALSSAVHGSMYGWICECMRTFTYQYICIYQCLLPCSIRILVWMDMWLYVHMYVSIYIRKHVHVCIGTYLISIDQKTTATDYYRITTTHVDRRYEENMYIFIYVYVYAYI